MGLSIEVGMLVDQAANDPQGLAHFREQFERLNAQLAKRGLPAHREPESGEGLPWSTDMLGYSGLHAVRRLGAHLWAGKPLPPPGGKEAADDPILERTYAKGRPPAGFLGLGSPNGPPFAHLINHSDSEGFYVPVDFEAVIPCTEREVVGGEIGSTPRLNAELERLAKELELPLTLDPDSDEVLEAAERPPSAGPKWKRYGVESFGLLRLWKACEVSMRHRSAIVFC